MGQTKRMQLNSLYEKTRILKTFSGIEKQIIALKPSFYARELGNGL